MDSPRSALLDEVDLEAPWELVETFSRQPRWRPEDVNRGADMIVARLTALGVPVTIHEPEIYLSIPFEAEVRTAGRVIRAKPPAYSASAPEGVTGEIAYAPAEYSRSIGTLFDKNAKAVAPEQLRGRIVVSEGFAFPHKVRELEALGAIGVIAVNPGTDIHWGICTSIWGTPDLDDLPRKPTIPVAAVNNPDGRELIALAGTGAQVTLATRLEEGWYRQKLPVVEIEGGAEPEKFVLLHGHYDSWDVGVGDNATGNSTLLEIARVLARHRKRLRRSVRIAWWPGHSTGRYAGSTWYADAFAIDLDENCVAQINCDSPGCRWATQFKDVSWMKETEAFAQRTIKAVTGLDAHGERPHRAGDYSFNNIGISSLMMLSSTMPDALRDAKGYYAVGGCGGNIAWHTENDTIEIADRAIMLRDIKVYLEIAGGIADAEIIPFDWRAQLDEFVETVDAYQHAAGAGFDLGPAKAACLSLRRALAGFYADVEAGRVRPRSANDVIQGLARILVPINYTAVSRFRHDPALPIPPLPTIALAAELERQAPDKLGFAKVQLTRGQNRLVAALRDAERLVAATG
jgi:N-acetylated-alpha-linked acidic dipeptidase